MLVGCLILPYCGDGGRRYPLFVAVLKLGSGLNDFFFIIIFWIALMFCGRRRQSFGLIMNILVVFWWMLLLLSLAVMFESVCVCM